MDHIFYTPSTPVPLGRWFALEHNEHSRKVGLPNYCVPTDHLPITILFERHPHPQLSLESIERLVESLNVIESSQKVELNSQSLAAQQKRMELEHCQVGKNKDKSTIETKSKLVKKSKKPSLGFIELIRNSRTMMEELKAEQHIQSQKFISERVILERMVLQHHGR